jgi:hypothetical protein
VSEEKEKKKEKEGKEDVEELKEVLDVVSKEIPGLIKGIIGSIFSEEAGKDMGKAAAAFYKQLKDAGMPDETAVKMTENYVSVFTSLGDIMKMSVGGEKRGKEEDLGKEISEEVSRKIKERLAEKHREQKEEEEH